jgi:hypothetical protein
MQKVVFWTYLNELVQFSIVTLTESSLEAEKIQIECLNNKFVIGLWLLVVSDVYLCLIERGTIFVFIAFSDRSYWAKECHLSVCDPTNIDQAKSQQSFTCFVYKKVNEILPSRMSN